MNVRFEPSHLLGMTCSLLALSLLAARTSAGMPAADRDAEPREASDVTPPLFANALFANAVPPGSPALVASPESSLAGLPVTPVFSLGSRPPALEEDGISAARNEFPGFNAGEPELTSGIRSAGNFLSQSDPLALESIPPVSGFLDVRPGDWAYGALRSLQERYACIQGYEDLTFRGNRPITRYEFAAALSSCLDVLVTAGRDSGIQLTQADLLQLQRLQQEYAAELTNLQRRGVDLEDRIQFLENHQFSITSKLFGQVVFGIQTRSQNTADFFPVDGTPDTDDPSTNTNFISNVQLTLLTQFSPRSIMLTGLQAGTGSTAPRLSNDTRLGYEGDTDGEFILSDLNYRQLIGNRFAFVIGPRGVNAVNVFRGANRIESAGRGPLSAFAQRNPIINIGGSGGIGFDWQLNPRLSIQGVYSASLLGDTENGGIFGGEDGETATGIQLTAVPFDTLDVTFSYINAYSPFGRLGTGIGDDQLTNLDAPLKTQAYGITVAWQPTSQFRLGGWGGYTHSVIPGRTGSVETFNWMAFANLSDIFITDDLLGVYVGQPPRISSSTLPVGQNIPDLLAGGLGEEGEQPGTTTHVELFYRFPIAENIVLTPGAIVLFEPGNTPDSDTIVIGALRMTFNF